VQSLFLNADPVVQHHRLPKYSGTGRGAEARGIIIIVAGAGVAGAGEGPAEVEKDVEEHHDTEIVCVAGTRRWAVRAVIPR
jgi:hypothetical protein